MKDWLWWWFVVIPGTPTLEVGRATGFHLAQVRVVRMIELAIPAPRVVPQSPDAF